MKMYLPSRVWGRGRAVWLAGAIRLYCPGPLFLPFQGFLKLLLILIIATSIAAQLRPHLTDRRQQVQYP